VSSARLRQTRRRRDAGAGLDPGRGQTKTGYFWAIARDDRPWGGPDPPAVVYTHAPGRGGEHLEKLLANYRGIVYCDGTA
jgi:transposase